MTETRLQAVQLIPFTMDTNQSRNLTVEFGDDFIGGEGQSSASEQQHGMGSAALTSKRRSPKPFDRAGLQVQADKFPILCESA
jgi:hypothetical protein